MTPTPFLSVIPQRHGMDCAVACLAMLLNVSYETALLAFGTPAVLTGGAEVRAVKAAAKRLRQPLRLRLAFDLETDTGILGVRSAKWATEHLVVLKDGLIVDTDATIWDADVFLAAYDAQAVSLLTL